MADRVFYEHLSVSSVTNLREKQLRVWTISAVSVMLSLQQ